MTLIPSCDGPIWTGSAFNRDELVGKGARLMHVALETTSGPILLRPEQRQDADFLYALFRSHTLTDFAALPVDDAARENLVRMQFIAQTNGYRDAFPDARFDIVCRDSEPIGRLIVDRSPEATCIVDFALLPAFQGGGLGTAILAGVLAWISETPTVVRCKVMWNNTPSLRMCQRLGFVPVDRDVPFVQLEWRPSGRA
jgi:RimJ/RimL family protein N-acetyltransferase